MASFSYDCSMRDNMLFPKSREANWKSRFSTTLAATCGRDYPAHRRFVRRSVTCIPECDAELYGPVQVRKQSHSVTQRHWKITFYSQRLNSGRRL